MIALSNILVKYGDRLLLNDVNLVITAQDKIGLVGRNGAGKSTLLKIIAGQISADVGSVARPKESTLGFLHQEMTLPKGKSVMAETLTAFEHVIALEKQIGKINAQLAERTDYESKAYQQLITRLTELNDRFHLLGGQSMEGQAERVLKGLGFSNKDMQRLTDEFSGGWQMRIELAKMLLRQPDYLLLDEPTNHLDIESIIWLEAFLRDYGTAVVVISHDKEFLDHVTKRTLEIELGKMYDYKASYSKYIEMRKERKLKQQAAFSNQQRVIAQKERTINRFMAKASKTKMAQSMKKQLDKIERIEIDSEDTAAMNIQFPPAPRSGQVVVEASKLSKSYDRLQVLDQVALKIDRGDRIAFVGQNGQGKTTLAKLLIGELTPSEGTVELGHNVQIGYYAQNQSESLYADRTVLQTMEAASPPHMRTRLRGILGAFMFSGEDVDKKVSVLSGGEKARLALACLLLKPFNLLVLDEPTNHLDMLSKEVLKEALMQYDGSLIVVSHDRDFLKTLTNRTLEFRDRQLFNYIGDVNAFLEKRKLETMREVEISQSNTHDQAAKKNNRKLSQQERQEKKRLQRSIQYAERKIEELEEKIATAEKQMAEPGFYESANAQEITERYQQQQQELEKQMMEWEVAMKALETLLDK